MKSHHSSQSFKINKSVSSAFVSKGVAGKIKTDDAKYQGCYHILKFCFSNPTAQVKFTCTLKLLQEAKRNFAEQDLLYKIR